MNADETLTLDEMLLLARNVMDFCEHDLPECVGDADSIAYIGQCEVNDSMRVCVVVGRSPAQSLAYLNVCYRMEILGHAVERFAAEDNRIRNLFKEINTGYSNAELSEHEAIAKVRSAISGGIARDCQK
ncbi:hypothetical protein JW868_01975 [Candidatus Woesearchaeota archaeon]|nr:hypothetical protein [Candidatus Woesearchaeota archaeon]